MQPGLLNYGKVNGKYYVLPWNDGATGIVYNKKMFTQYGWEVPETVADLLALCQTIKTDTNNEVSPFTWGGQVGSYWNFPTVAWWAQVEGVEGMKTFNQYGSASVYAQNGRLLALQAFEDLIVKDKTNSVSGVMSKNHISSQMDFVTGRAAMIPNGSWISNEMKGSAPSDFEYAMMPTPFVSEEYNLRTNYTAAGDFIMIPKMAANKALAKKFLTFMATDEMIQLYLDVAVGILPYQYNYDLTNADTFTKSVVEINMNSENIYMYGTNAMYYRNLVNLWPISGSPYGMIFDGTTAEELFEMERDQSALKWELWKSQAGM